MLNKVALPIALLGLVLALVACAPQVAPAPAAATQAPVSVATKAPEPTKPAASTATALPAATPTPKPATVRFGSTQNTADAGVYMAIEKGYFKEQGITVELNGFRSVADMIAPLSTGQLDVGFLAVSTALLAAADRGLDLKVVGGTIQQIKNSDTAWIVLRKDLWDSGRVKSPADLKGMTIAIASQGSTSEQMVQTIVEQAGLKPGSDVQVVVIASADQMAALSNNAIAAGYTIEPFIATGVQQGIAVKWLSLSQFFGGRAQGGLVVFSPILAKDQGLGRRWMIAYLKGVRDYLKALSSKEERGQVVDILIKYTSLKDRALYDVMEMPYLDPNGSIDKNSVDLQYKWLVDKGLYTGKTTFDGITDMSFAQFATQTLGKQ